MASARKPLTAVRLDRTLDSRHLRSRHTIRGGAVESIWQSGVLDPQGPIGAAERLILINATVVMLAVILPIIVLTLGFAWWFRAGNDKAIYWPTWQYSGPIELVVWSIPALVVTFLGGMVWISTHDLDPPKLLQSQTAP